MTSSIEAAKQSHSQALLGRSDYIPLLIGTRCPDAPSREALWKDTAAAVAGTIRAYEPRRQIESDWLPSVNIGVFQCIAIPSCFGARVAEIKGSEPICHPHFADIQQAVDAGVPELESPVIDDLFETLDQATGALEDGWYLSFPASASPWDLAQVLLGEEFLIAAMLEPEATRQFLDNLTTCFIELTRRVKQRMGQGDREYVSNRGVYAPGYRLPSDAIVNFSPDLLRTYLPGVIDRIAETFGPVIMHFCTKPAPSGHVLPVLTEIENVMAVDNWQGPDVFIGPDAPARMQQKVSIIGDVRIETAEHIDELLSWPAVTDVPRNGGRGIIFNAWCPDVQHGREIYAMWQERFER
ncbi:MAG: hypothetical protein ACLFUJ_04085 [Phycisphaerae bacterium]